MADIEEKQKYLRDHIPAEDYEDFAEFCMTYFGSLDIETWSLDNVKEIVQKFFEQKNNEPDTHQKSFAIYQSSTGQVVATAITEILAKTQTKKQQMVPNKENDNKNQMNYHTSNQQNGFKKKPKEVQIVNSPQKQKSSAVDLLDEVFQEVDQGQKTKIQQNSQKMGKSFFDSVNFWEVPKGDKNEKKTIQNKQRASEIQTFNYDPSTSFDNYFNTGMPKSQQSYVSQKQFTTFSHFTDQELKKKEKVQQQQKGQKKKKTLRLKQAKDQPEKKEMKKKKYDPKIPYQGATLIKQPFKDKVSCIKSAVRPVLSDPNFKVVINTFQIIHRNFFVSDYIMYHIKIKPSDQVCKRNYQDFSKLRNTLAKVYPGIQLPYLEKDSWISDTSPEFAKKQSQVLQFFLRDILANKQLRNSRIVEDFLTFPDHKKIKRKFEDLDKMQKLKSIEELCLMSGDVQINVTEDQRIYCEKVGKFMEKMQNNLDKYRKNGELLSHHYNSTMSTLSTLTDLLKQMQEDVIDFNKRIKINEINNLDDSLKMIRTSYQEQYLRLKFEKKILDDKVLPFVRYEKENVHISKQIVDTCAAMTTRYLKRVDHEGMPKKSSSYLSNSNNEFKSGVLEESKNLLVYQYQVGYINTQMSCESERIFESLSNKINKRWKSIGRHYLEEMKKGIDFWTTVV